MKPKMSLVKNRGKQDNSPFSHYYGELDVKLVRKDQTIGLYCVDDMYKKMLEKHEDKLLKAQCKLINDMSRRMEEDVTRFKRKISELMTRLDLMERKMELFK